MAVWETDPGLAAQSALRADFATMWQAATKVVYSTTLDTVATAKTRLERSFDADAILAAIEEERITFTFVVSAMLQALLDAPAIAHADLSSMRNIVTAAAPVPVPLLKRAVAARRFGRIFMVNINVFWSRPQAYYDSAAWRGTWEFDGGAFMNQASHYVDLLDWLIGPVESVQAYTATLERDIEVEDTGVLAVRWRSGALGTMSVTMLTYPKNYEGSVTIVGEKGTVRLGGVAVNRIEHWEFAEPDPDDALVTDASYQAGSVYGLGHPLYYQNVIQFYCTFDDKFLPDRYVIGKCPFCGAEGQYSDLCEKCGRVPDQILNPKCAICGRPPVKRESSHYFFRLSSFGQKLKDWLNMPVNMVIIMSVSSSLS